MTTRDTEAAGDKMTVDIRVYCDPTLKQIAIDEARRRKLPLSELVTQALAEFLDRPDLADVPRLPPGRPLKDVTNGHKNGKRQKAIA